MVLICEIASALVFLLVIATLPVTSPTVARSIDVEISVMKYDWLSNETVELSVEISNAPFNQQFVAQYTIQDLSGNEVLIGDHVFQSSPYVTQFPLLVKHFFDTSNFTFYKFQYSIQVTQSFLQVKFRLWFSKIA